MHIEITLKEVVTLAQAGDNDAKLAIFKKYQPLIAMGVNTGLNYDIPPEDMGSIIIEAMLIGLNNFDINVLD